MTTNGGTTSIAGWSRIPLRLIVGYGFMAHGFAKLSRGPDVFAAALNGLGVPAPHVMAWLTIGIELLGGAAILLGAFVVVASIPMTAILLVAIVTVHLPYGFSSIKLVAVTTAGPQFGKPGYETALLYIACLAALVVGGAGPLSVDNFIGARRHHYKRLTADGRTAIALPRSSVRCSVARSRTWSILLQDPGLRWSDRSRWSAWAPFLRARFARRSRRS